MPALSATINTHSFAVAQDETLLEAGERHALSMPFACRGGTCGTCRATLVSGQVAMPPTSEICLTQAQVEAGEILLCVARPVNDVEIICPDVRPASAGDGPRAFTVTACERPAVDVLILRLQSADGLPVDYAPGQFVNILSEREGSRSYSIATPRSPTGIIDLHVRLKPDGQFTPWLFSCAAPGMALTLTPAFGRFQIDESDTGARLFVASGTGFAPVRAMLEDLFRRRDKLPKWLYWGGRRPADLYQDAIARRWTKLYPEFRYVPVISDAHGNDVWSGRDGLVHRAALADHPDMSGMAVYACGLPQMVDACRTDFVCEAGLDITRFHADSFA
jgi:CDP-4-dehydro-6-deoxyglucose reductase, E3